MYYFSDKKIVNSFMIIQLIVFIVLEQYKAKSH